MQKVTTCSAAIADASVSLTENTSQMEARILKEIKVLLMEMEERMNAKIDNAISSLAKMREIHCRATDQIADINRVQRMGDIIIRGIPYYVHENVGEIVKNIAVAIDHSLTPYTDAFRFNAKRTSRGGGPILVRLSGHAEQKAFLNAFLKKKGMKLCEIAGFNSESPIFIHESITPMTSSLLHEALRYRRQGKIYSAITRNGHLFVKKSKELPATKVIDREKLDTIVNSAQLISDATSSSSGVVASIIE